MLNKKNLFIGGAIVVGLYLLNPYVGSTRGDGAAANADFNYKSDQLKITNFVGSVNLIKSVDDQIHIQVTNIKHGMTPHFDNIAGRIEVSGSEAIGSSSCNGFSLFSLFDEDESQLNISINGGKSREITEYPTLSIQAPESIHLTLSDSIIMGEFTNVEQLTIVSNSCSVLDFSDVANDARIELKGSGNIEIGNVGGTAGVSLTGSGDINIGKVSDDSVSSIRGSGNLHYDALAGISKMNIRGSGNIDVDYMTGDAEFEIRGSGDIRVAGGELNWFIANVSGSGNVDYDGSAVNFRSNVKGSGDINTRF